MQTTLIEHNKRLVQDFELFAFAEILNIPLEIFKPKMKITLNKKIKSNINPTRKSWIFLVSFSIFWYFLAFNMDFFVNDYIIILLLCYRHCNKKKVFTTYKQKMEKNIMTRRFKGLSILLACVLTLCMGTTAFAASTPTDENPQNSLPGEIIEVTVPADGNTYGMDDDGFIVPMAQGNVATFKLGSTGYISNCGFNPKFKFTARGGSSNTTVKFYITTSGGVNYTQGDIKADGSQYIEKQYVVFNGGGTWAFTASVVSGENNGNITCTVTQTY